MIPAALLVRNPRPRGRRGPAATPRPGREFTAAQALRTPQFAAIALTHFACCAAHSGPIFHMVTHAIDHGVSAMAATTVLGAAGLPRWAGGYVRARGRSRRRQAHVLLVGLAIQALAVSLYLVTRQLCGLLRARARVRLLVRRRDAALRDPRARVLRPADHGHGLRRGGPVSLWAWRSARGRAAGCTTRSAATAGSSSARPRSASARSPSPLTFRPPRSLPAPLPMPIVVNSTTWGALSAPQGPQRSRRPGAAGVPLDDAIRLQALHRGVANQGVAAARAGRRVHAAARWGSVLTRRPCASRRSFAAEHGRILATLIRLLGDIDVAEEALQDGVRGGARALAGGRHAGESGEPGRSPRGGTRRSTQAAPRRSTASRGSRRRSRGIIELLGRGGGCARARRSAAADLHVLPSRTRTPTRRSRSRCARSAD